MKIKIRDFIYTNCMLLNENTNQNIRFHFFFFHFKKTITAQNTIRIQKIEPHPYDLKALKKCLALFDKARSMQLETQPENPKKRPSFNGLRGSICDTYLQADPRRLRNRRNFAPTKHAWRQTWPTDPARRIHAQIHTNVRRGLTIDAAPPKMARTTSKDRRSRPLGADCCRNLRWYPEGMSIARIVRQRRKSGTPQGRSAGED